jgi:predicted nucleotidyltransferase component of viral defense system
MNVYCSPMWSDREAVELFHLHFVRLLFVGRDKGNFVVKGGCNLRFFFGSARYSEDIDLDVRGGTVHALRERVDSILSSKTLREPLLSTGIDVRRVTAPKQTPTTQRWKIQIQQQGRDLEASTKIEFSRRADGGEAALEAVEPRLVGHYRLMPVLANHYVLATAIRQKIGALVNRREVQARDVFDLSLLFARRGGDVRGLEDLGPDLRAAIDRVWSLSFADYQGQVVAFLEPDQADLVGTRESWDAIQLQVVTALESIGERT